VRGAPRVLDQCTRITLNIRFLLISAGNNLRCWLLQNLSICSLTDGTRIQKVESECALDIGMDLWSQDKEMVRTSTAQHTSL